MVLGAPCGHEPPSQAGAEAFREREEVVVEIVLVEQWHGGRQSHVQPQRERAGQPVEMRKEQLFGGCQENLEPYLVPVIGRIPAREPRLDLKY